MNDPSHITAAHVILKWRRFQLSTAKGHLMKSFRRTPLLWIILSAVGTVAIAIGCSSPDVSRTVTNANRPALNHRGADFVASAGSATSLKAAPPNPIGPKRTSHRPVAPLNCVPNDVVHCVIPGQQYTIGWVCQTQGNTPCSSQGDLYFQQEGPTGWNESFAPNPSLPPNQISPNTVESYTVPGNASPGPYFVQARYEWYPSPPPGGTPPPPRYSGTGGWQVVVGGGPTPPAPYSVV